MTKLLLLSTFFFFSLTAFSQTKEADKILGVWLTEKNDGKIEIYRSGNQYFGKLIWGKSMYEADGKTSKKDEKNPDAKLKTRDYKDLVLLTNLTYDNGEYRDGKVYDTESGKTYSCTVKLTNGYLKLRAYLGISFLGKTTEWTRVQ